MGSMDTRGNLDNMGDIGGIFKMGGMSDMEEQTEREKCAWPPAWTRRQPGMGIWEACTADAAGQRRFTDAH